MIVYRIVNKEVTELLMGSGNDGRWCSNGRKVIYTSSSIALACLENILRRSGSGFSLNFKTISYQIPEDVIIDEVKITNLTPEWRSENYYTGCQKIGNEWYDNKASLILKVPSAIIPDEYNFIIKTTSLKIDRITIKAVQTFVPDARLEKILLSAGAKPKNRKALE